MSDPAPQQSLRRELTRLVQQLVQEGDVGDGHRLASLLTAHLGADAHLLPIVRANHPAYDLPNLQLALQALAERDGWCTEVMGVAGQGRRYAMLGLSDLLTSPQWRLGPPDYQTAEVGPHGRTLQCLVFGLLLLDGTSGPAAAMVSLGEQHGPGGATVQVDIAAPGEGVAAALHTRLAELIGELDVFRGQVITVEAEPMTGSRSVRFAARPEVTAQDLVLPEGVLERIERHVLGAAAHRDALIAAGRRLGRGLLLWGPPGTGKTLTVRYLTARLAGTTVVILSGPALGMAGSFGALARRLQPAVVVLEDVDLVAEERGFTAYPSSPVLFDLMNEMSGTSGDADITFVLTTNRPDALEPALAARPGRVDLAVEIPMPDADGRRRLLERYARGIDLQDGALDGVVSRTEGVTASFIEELLRRAVLGAAEDGRTRVTGDDVRVALEELLHHTAALTRVLLGSRDPAGAAPPDAAHGWIRAFPAPGAAPGV